MALEHEFWGLRNCNETPFFFWVWWFVGEIEPMALRRGTPEWISHQIDSASFRAGAPPSLEELVGGCQTDFHVGLLGWDGQMSNWGSLLEQTRWEFQLGFFLPFFNIQKIKVGHRLSFAHGIKHRNVAGIECSRLSMLLRSWSPCQEHWTQLERIFIFFGKTNHWLRLALLHVKKREPALVSVCWVINRTNLRMAWVLVGLSDEINRSLANYSTVRRQTSSHVGLRAEKNRNYNKELLSVSSLFDCLILRCQAWLKIIWRVSPKIDARVRNLLGKEDKSNSFTSAIQAINSMKSSQRKSASGWQNGGTPSRFGLGLNEEKCWFSTSFERNKGGIAL